MKLSIEDTNRDTFITTFENDTGSDDKNIFVVAVAALVKSFSETSGIDSNELMAQILIYHSLNETSECCKHQFDNEYCKYCVENYEDL